MKIIRNKAVLFLAVCTLIVHACNPPETVVETQPHETSGQLNIEDSKEQVRQVLQQQSECWSQGDLECYMQGYWKSDSLLFIGSSGLTYGWQQTLDNYKKGYPDASAMGELTFDLKEMRPISPDAMLVVGKWHLKREAAKGDLEGHFSVLFKHFADGWKIVADHSS